MFRIFFFLLGLLIECDGAEKQINREQIQDIVKANLSQKIAFKDFQIIVENWIEGWGKTNLSSEAAIKNLEITADGRRFNGILVIGTNPPRKIKGKIEQLVDIPVLKNLMGTDKIITAADITWQKISVDQITANTVIHQEDLIGKTSRQGVLKVNVPLNLTQIQVPIVVKKGDLVQISYKSPNLLITTQAFAQRHGSVGEVIPYEPLIQNGTSLSPAQKKIIYAKITAPNQAEVLRPT